MSRSTRTDAGGLARGLAVDERGTALVEFAFVGSLLLMMVLGVIEYGNVFSDVHTLTSLSREGANLAARGATLSDAVANVLANGSDVHLAERGGVVASRLAVRNGGARVEEQVASPGYSGQSRVGLAGGPAQNVASWGLQDNQTVYAVEIFYRYEAVTPCESVVGFGVPDTLYERAVF
jgi:hypothetical protein